MNFGMIILSLNMEIMQDYAIWIQIALLLILKQKIFYADIASDVERCFDISNYEKEDKRPLPIGKNEKEIGLFKDKLGEKIMTEFCALRAKAYAYLKDDGSEHKKAKGTKKCIIKRELMFENYKHSLFNDKIILKSQQRIRSYYHEVCIEEVIMMIKDYKHLIKLQRFPME